ncbi:MAG: hypothetical protein ACPGKG_08160 [Paracoccaceae bacterium]
MKKTDKNKKSVSSTTNKTSPEALKIIQDEVEYETRLRRKEPSDKLNEKRISSKDSKSIKEVTTEQETLGLMGNSIIILTGLGIILKIIHSNSSYIVDKFPVLEGVLLKYEYFIFRITDSRIIEKIIYLFNNFSD